MEQYLIQRLTPESQLNESTALAAVTSVATGLAKVTSKPFRATVGWVGDAEGEARVILDYFTISVGMGFFDVGKFMISHGLNSRIALEYASNMADCSQYRTNISRFRKTIESPKSVPRRRGAAKSRDEPKMGTRTDALTTRR